MEYWEFLLQKEGDRSWLPLESPVVEILEGRYRIIARSSYLEAEVMVRASYLPDGEFMPSDGQPRVQQRSAMTNNSGLIVIAPFTLLKPGRWDFSCAAVAGAGGSSEPAWHHTVRLQVAAIEADLWEEVTVVLGGTAAASASIDGSISEPIGFGSMAEPIGSEAFLDQASSRPSADLADRFLQRLAETASRWEPAQGAAPGLASPGSGSQSGPTRSPQTADPGPPTSPTSLPEPVLQPLPPAVVQPVQPSIAPAVALQLDRLTYVMDWHQPLVLTGRITSQTQGALTTGRSRWPDALPDQPPAWALVPTVEWRALLRDPGTQRIVVRAVWSAAEVIEARGDRSVSDPIALPARFACGLTLPIESKTFLLLGELALYATDQADAEPLAVQTFTVSAEAETLLAAIEPEFQPLPPAFKSAPATPSLDFHFLNFVPPPPGGRTAARPEATGADRLNPAGQPAPTHLSLPSVSASVPIAPESDSATPAAWPLPNEAPLPDSVGFTPLPPDLRDRTLRDRNGFPAEPPGSRSGRTTGPAEPNQPDNHNGSTSASPKPSPGALRSPFDRLHLQERFWNRLSVMAQDEDLGDWLRSRSPDAAPPKPEPRDPDARWTAQEVVFDHGSARSSRPAEARLADNEPIPVPIVDVTNELGLQMGQTMLLRVRIPEVNSRLAVRLWVEDRRSREVIESPRWLLEFYPNGLDELETRLAIPLPPHVLDVAIGAVTVEITTQRESAKTERRLKTQPL